MGIRRKVVEGFLQCTKCSRWLSPRFFLAYGMYFDGEARYKTSCKKCASIRGRKYKRDNYKKIRDAEKKRVNNSREHYSKIAREYKLKTKYGISV